MFIDQTANDAGRTSLSWLPTSLPEPNFAQTQKEQSAGGSRAVHQTRSAQLDISKRGLSQGFGLLRLQDQVSESGPCCRSTWKGRQRGNQASQALEAQEEDEGRSFVLDHRMRQPGGSDPRAQLACETPLPGSSTPERRDCFPTATFNRGVEQDRASTQAVEEMSPELASQRECMEL